MIFFIDQLFLILICFLSNLHMQTVTYISVTNVLIYYNTLPKTLNISLYYIKRILNTQTNEHCNNI